MVFIADLKGKLLLEIIIIQLKQNMKTLLVPIFFFCSLLSLQQLHGQEDYVKAEIHLESGGVLQTYVAMPIINEMAMDKIAHARNETAKREKIKSNEIDFIVLESNGKKKLLKRSTTWKKGGKKVRKIYSWLSLVHACENMSIYNQLVGFDINSDGDFLDLYKEGVGMICIQRTGEEYPNMDDYYDLINMLCEPDQTDNSLTQK